MDEPQRTKQIGIKLSDQEYEELSQCSSYAGMQVTPWCREVLLAAARGERAAKNVEVPRASLEALQATQERQIKILLAVLDQLLQHTHFGRADTEHEDPNLRALGKKRAARKMATLMAELGLANGEIK